MAKEPTWIYIVVAEAELDLVVEACLQAGLYHEIDECEDGELRVYFYEEDQEMVEELAARVKEQLEQHRFPALVDTIKAANAQAHNNAQGKRSLVPPTAVENRWAEEKMAEELKELKKASGEPEAEVVGKPRRKRKSQGRTNQIKTRLTDAEMVQFQRRLKKSGLAQGDFLRSAALTGQIVIEDYSVADVAMLDELAMIRADLGRQGGLLKMIIKPNEGQRELAPEEWAELIGAIRDMEKIKKRLSDLEVRVQHGNRKAQDK